MSHRQSDQDAQDASAPTQGGPHPPTPRGPPGTGNEAGSEGEGKRLRPNLINSSTYVTPTRASKGILVDYPDSPGSDSISPVPDQASPEGRPGQAWPNQTPEKPGTNEADPDSPARDMGSGSKLGVGKEGTPDLDSGFKSIKTRSFGSPCSSVDMFADSQLDPDAGARVDSSSDSDVVPNSLTHTPLQSRIPILRLPKLSTSSLSDQGNSQIVGRKRKGGQVPLSSSSSSASDSDVRMEGGSGLDDSGNSGSDPEGAGEPELGGVRGAKTKPEAKPKGKGKPRLSPLDFTSDSLNDFKIPKRKGRLTKVEIKQISILKNFENKSKVNYKNTKNPNPKPGRGRGSGRGGSGRSRSGSARSRKPNDGVPYLEMIKNGLSYGTKTTSHKQAPKMPPWIPSGSTRGNFPPLPPVGSHKGSVQDVKTDKQLKAIPVNDSVPTPSTSAGNVGTSKSRRPLMLPDTICPTKPPQKPLQKSPQTLSHRVEKAQKTQFPVRPPTDPSVPLAIPQVNQNQNQTKPKIQFQPPFKPQRVQMAQTPSTRPSASSATSSGAQKENPTTNMTTPQHPQPPPQQEPRTEPEPESSHGQVQDKPKFIFKDYVNQMTAPTEQKDLTTNFHLSLSLGEGGDTLGGPPPPLPPLPPPLPRRPEVRPLPAASILKYEIRLFDLEVEDKGLNWKRIPRRGKVNPRDKAFNFMCQPFLENRITSLVSQAGCTENNEILKLVTQGLSENVNPFGDQIPQFPDPHEYCPFGNPIGPARGYAPAPGVEDTLNKDPNKYPNLQTLMCNLQPCPPCSKIIRRMSCPAPAPRPDPSKFHFRPSETPKIPFSDKVDYFNCANNNPNGVPGLQSVSYTTKSGRVTTRLTPTTPDGHMAPPHRLAQPGPCRRRRRRRPWGRKDQDRSQPRPRPRARGRRARGWPAKKRRRRRGR